MRTSLFLTAFFLLLPAVGGAQVRVEPESCTYTTSSPPHGAWFRVHNDGDRELRIAVSTVVHLARDGEEPLRATALIDATTLEPVTSIPAHGTALLIAEVTGWRGERAHASYTFRVTLRDRVTGARYTVVTQCDRAYRHPLR